jgi:hypothetical protein
MNIAPRLTHTITIQSQTGVDGAGDPAWSAQTTLKARVEHGTKKLVGANGEEKQAEHVAVTLTELSLEHRVWFPGDDTADLNAAKRPLMIKKADTFDGYTIFETYF